MTRLYLLCLALIFSFGTAHAEDLNQSRLQINKMFMFDKCLLGGHVSYMMPVGGLSKELMGSVGGNLGGKYYISNFVAFGFDIAFFRPKFKPDAFELAKTPLAESLALAQRRQYLSDTIRIQSISGRAQWIPFNFNIEFYLPKQAFKNFRPFAGIGIGLHIINRHYEPTFNVPLNNRLNQVLSDANISRSQGFFSLSPNIGFLATFNELWNLNFDIRYHLLLSQQIEHGLSVNIGLLFNISNKYY